MKQLITLSIVLYSSIVFAQIEKFIPKNSGLVCGISPKQVKTKVDIDSLLTLPIYNKLQSGFLDKKEQGRSLGKNMLYALLFDQLQLGVSTNENWYFYLTNDDKIICGSFIIPLNDSKKWEDFIATENGLDLSKSIQKKGYKTITKNKFNNTWSDEYAVFHIGGVTDDYLEETSPDADYDQKKEIERKILTEYFEDANAVLFKKSKDNLVSSSPAFKKVIEENHDAFVWANSRNLISDLVIKEIQREFRRQEQIKQFIDKLKDNPWAENACLTLDFKDNKAVSSFSITLNDNLSEFIKDLYSKKISPELGRYIDAEKAQVVYGSAFNTEAIKPLIAQLFDQIASDIPQIGPISKDIYSLYELVIDEEAILNVIGNESAIAFYGMSPKPYEYTYFDYSEDYSSSTKKTRTDTLLVPMLTYTMKTGDPSRIQSILNIAEYGKVIFKEKDYYTFSQNKINFYIFLQDDFFVITTDQELVTKYRKGFPQKKRQTYPNAYNTFAQVQITQLVKQLLPNLNDIYDDQERAICKAIMQHFTKATYTGVEIDKNTFSVKLELEITPSNQNSLTSFLGYINTQRSFIKSERDIRRKQQKAKEAEAKEIEEATEETHAK